ncbi:MAG: NUDIX domain-containing protein, partial [Coriobacteriia bacterium]
MAARVSERPRVRVAAVIVIDGRVLLVRQRKSDAPYHLLPGGGVDARETLAQALRREVAEETGLVVELDRPLFINDTIDPAGIRHSVNITFLTHVTGGALLAKPTDPSIEGFDIVEFTAIRDLDMRPPIAAELEDAAAAGFAVET